MTNIARETLVTVFGGSGFVGRHVVRALAQRGYRIRVAVRRPDLAGFLQPLGRVGQIHAVQANVRFPDSVSAAMRDSALAINLVGILFERGRQRFLPVHSHGAETVARAAIDQHARVIHVSAIGADEHARSRYARTKAAGENAVREIAPAAIIFRPSVVFGPEDDFFNRFAALARISPFLPLIGSGRTRFQPVFVGDVAEALARAADGTAKTGTTYELGGPEILTMRELMRLVLALVERKRLPLPIPFSAAKLVAQVLQLMPQPLLTPDQVELLRHDTVVSTEAAAEGRAISALGIDPVAIAAIVPAYLWRFRKAGQFNRRRAA